MCETIYVEKNKSNRFGVHFYHNLSEWDMFLDAYGVKKEQLAFIYNKSMENKDWKAWIEAKQKDAVLALDKKTEKSYERLWKFLNCYREEYTLVIFAEPFIMEMLQDVVMMENSKLCYVLIPATPFALFDSVSIKPKKGSSGDIITKEIFPLGIYVDTSVMLNANTDNFLSGIACAFRLSISYKAAMFEWMISNLYELLDCEKSVVCELLERGYGVHKERIEKDTLKDRCIPAYGMEFYKLLSEMNPSVSEADLLALSMVCQSYLSWKSELLSMEEYYEIRDMFVAFGLAITETFASESELMNALETSASELIVAKESVYIRKIGKIITAEAPSLELIKDALSQIYFNEYENE